MGKRSHLSTVTDQKTKEKLVKPSLCGETFGNNFTTNIKSNKLKKSKVKEIIKERVVEEENVDAEETKKVELSSCKKKMRTDQNDKTYATKNADKTDMNSIDKVTSNVSLDSNVLAAIPNHKVKTKRKNQNDAFRQNTKIKFTDGEESVEVSQNSIIGEIDDMEPLNEEDVKDEDIDKFCDEITEEDNEQYESWVKLIEAKLSGNKKKPKC